MRTGACRYGTHCKWRHPIPACSTTILVRNFYDGLGAVGRHILDEDAEDSLEVSLLAAVARILSNKLSPSPLCSFKELAFCRWVWCCMGRVSSF